MIIYKGLGFLVFVFVVASSLFFNILCCAWLGAEYYDTRKWPLGLSLLVSATACWVVGGRLRKRAPRVIVDKATGREMTLVRNQHDLFFIPMHYWGPILAVIGLLFIVFDYLRR